MIVYTSECHHMNHINSTNKLFGVSWVSRRYYSNIFMVITSDDKVPDSMAGVMILGDIGAGFFTTNTFMIGF